MTVTSRIEVQNGNAERIRCSIGIAAALLNVSDDEFARRYVRTGYLEPDRLHQFAMRDVLKLYKAVKK